MKNDQIIEKALVNIAQLMLNEDLVNPVMKGIEHCQPTSKQNTHIHKHKYIYAHIRTRRHAYTHIHTQLFI